MSIKTQMNCEIHGPYEARSFKLAGKDRLSPCPTCASQALEKANSPEAIEEQQRLQRIAHAVESFGNSIPIRFKNATFDNYYTADPAQNPTDQCVKAKGLCLKYAKNFDQRLKNGSGLILCGMVGTGKTHLALATGREIAKQGHFVEYENLTGIIRQIRETWGDDTKHENTVLRRLQTRDLLIIDEIGVQSGTENERNIIFEIINGRYENVKPTILISNLTKAEISNLISERSVDRVTDGGGGTIVFNWGSYRNRGVA